MVGVMEVGGGESTSLEWSQPSLALSFFLLLFFASWVGIFFLLTVNDTFTEAGTL